MSVLVVASTDGSREIALLSCWLTSLYTGTLPGVAVYDL